jgi:hypothetical protein
MHYRTIRHALIGLTVTVLAGCGATGGVTSTPDAGTKPAAASSAPTAKFGQAITVKGNTEGSQVQVTATKLVPSTVSTNQFEKPQDGMRYAAVQFKIVNTGTVPYEDSPSNGARLIDTDGQQFQSTIVSKLKAGAVFPGSVKLAKGGTALGYVVFEVPKAAKITGVQFGMDSGFAETAEWVVS